MPTRQAGVYFLLAGIICAVTAVYGFLSFSIVIAAATAIVAVKSQTGKRRISALFLIGAAFGTISSVWQECHRQSVPYPAIYGEFTVEITENSGRSAASGHGLTQVQIYGFNSAAGEQYGLTGKHAFVRLPENTVYGYGDIFRFDGTVFTPAKEIRINLINDRGEVQRQKFLPPDSFDQYMINRGFAGTIHPESTPEKIASNGGVLRKMFAARENLAGIITGGLTENYAAIIEAMLFNQRNNLEPETKKMFLQSGIIHLFSVSGMHVGIAALIIFAILRPLPWQMKNFTALAAVIMYVIICGAQPPAVRAAIMIGVYIVSQLCGLKIQPLSAIALAAVILLVFNPRNLFDLGFQFSFTVTAILLLFAQKQKIMRRYLAGDDLFLPLHMQRKPLRNCLKIKLPLTVTAGAAAYLAAMPLALHHQGMFIPASFPGNLFILPLTPLIFIVSGIRAVGSFIPPVYQLSGDILNFLVAVLEKIAGFIDSLFTPAVAITPNAWMTAAFIVAVAALFAGSRMRAAGFAVITVWCAVIFGAPLFARPFILIANGGTQIPMIAVADPSKNFAAALNAPDYQSAQCVSDFLQQHGVSQINYLALANANAADSKGVQAFTPGENLQLLILPQRKPTAKTAIIIAPYPCRTVGKSAIWQGGCTAFTLKNQFNVLHYREYQISARYQDDYGTTLISLPNGTVFELPRQKNLELYQYYLR